MTCADCGNTIRDSDSFCGQCGRALTTKVDILDSPPPLALGLAPWRGGQVALGVLIIAIAIIPAVLLSAVAGGLAGRYAMAATVWASSHIMGLVILGVVWQLGLKGFTANIRANLRGHLRSLGLNAPSTSLRRSALLTLGVLAGSLAATGVYAALVRWLDFSLLVPPDIPPDLVFPGAAAVLTFQALAVWTPITEEIFFRGFIFAGLASRLGIRGAMVGSALVFSLFHMDPGVLVPIFITGFLLAWLYHRTGSLWPNIVAHAGQNALALVVTIFFL